MLDKAVIAILQEENQKEAIQILDAVAEVLTGRRKEHKNTKSRINDGNNKLKVFEVQFNPTTLRYQGSGGIRYTGEEAKTQGEGKEQHTVSAEISLSMELICEGERTQEQVNGLLGLKLLSVNQSILFSWGDMTFTGTVVDVSGEYSMFDDSGRPIRGKVNLTIRQSGESRERLPQWKEAYESLGAGKK